ncbi:YrhC family protein [Geobacillus sp. E263]|uniref:YrhC family protein n=1 Tax=Geobacillus sp. E263 TaxID=391290 RepID=UPI00117B3C9A|nr:YrhC family protein [Geobacillus sp. E263]
MERQKQQWKEKADDYKMFAGVLLSLSVFLYIGTLLPTIAPEKKAYLLPFIVILLVGAFSFFQRAIKYLRLLRETDE